ncbi:hypothetical protein tloyanaT_04440 [Thalassotalea loyana]|uniref:Ice-binding protein C-terminal domain-containing protein n=1 Tax=Thalassotalea loyana TaxID=280483 RepID=A0ABQ6H7T4_9GAMM|nr:PEP-CTERM sorting domain-containing protein [Thalassotalea loyana]GLX84192.1 hypothetical protein tloyanaT_04440 [Thalassotalea loyana]
MKNKFLKGLVTSFALAFTGSANAGLIEYVVNGDFETGNTTGWTVINSGTTWNINDGSYDPCGPALPMSPISGSYDLVSAQCGPSTASFYQDLVLSSNFDSILLSWDDRIRNHHSSFNDSSQEFKVRLYDSNLSLINEIFSTNPNDALTQIGPNNRAFDVTNILTGYAGQQVRLEFWQNTQLFHFEVNLDNISLTSTTTDVPEPSTLAIFALGLMGLASRKFKKQA